jgi:hypothetical protein
LSIGKEPAPLPGVAATSCARAALRNGDVGQAPARPRKDRQAIVLATKGSAARIVCGSTPAAAVPRADDAPADRSLARANEGRWSPAVR